jgi:hypothetical protein
MVFLCVLAFSSLSMGQAGVTLIAASNGTNICKNFAANGTSPTYTTISNINLIETDYNDFPSYFPNPNNTITLVLAAPTGWAFKASTGSVSFSSGYNISAASIAVTASTITVTITVPKSSTIILGDQVTISGIQVQATTTAAASGYIYASSNTGSATGTSSSGVQVISTGSSGTNFGNLSLSSQISVSSQPADKTVCSGGTATFSVSATGGGASTTTYQWRKGTTNLTDGASGTGSTITGSSTSTLSIYNATASDAATDYNVVVSDGCTSATSNNATLTINGSTAPTIAVSASPSGVCGSSVTSTLTASGTSTSYSWSPSTFLSATTGNPVTATNVNTTTTYTVTGTAANGCTASAQVSVVITPTGGTTLFTETFNACSNNNYLFPACNWNQVYSSSSATTNQFATSSTGVSCNLDGTVAIQMTNGASVCTYTNTSATDVVAYKYINGSFSTVGYSAEVLTFDYKGQGESGKDYMQVCYNITNDPGTYSSWVPLTTQYNLAASLTSVSVNLPSACDGKSNVYIGFRWVNDASGGTAPGIVIDNITVKASGTINAPSTPSGITSRCQAAGSDSYTTFSSSAASYTWSISPASAGSVSGTSTTGTVTWLSSFSGTATISVTANNACGASSAAATQSVTVSALPVASAGSAINACSGSGTAIAMTGATVTNSFSSITWSGGGGLGTWSQSATDPALATFTPSVSSGSFTATLTINAALPCNTSTTSTSTRTVTWGGAAGTWIGATSTAWATASNWACSTIPTSSIDVVIPSTATNMPTISTTGNTAKSITINSGATLTMTSAGAITVSGDWTNNGTFTGNSASTVTFGGTTQQIAGTSTTAFGIITIANGSTTTGTVTHTATTFNINNGGKYIQQAGTVLPGTTKSFATGSTYELQTSSTLTWSGSTFGYLVINTTAGNNDAGGTLTTVNNDLYIKGTGSGSFRIANTTSPTVAIAGNLQVDAGTFNISVGTGTPAVTITGDVILNGGTFRPMTSTGVPTINVKGNWTNNGGTFTPGTTTITFNGTGAQSINGTATSQTFYNIAVAKTAGTLLNTGGSTTTVTTQDFTETTGNFTAPATLNINGNLTLTAGTFTAGTTINAAGNWTHATAATFTAGTGTNVVNFTGTGAQTINGTATSETFNNVVVAKTAGTLLNTGGSVATLTTQDFTETTGNFTAPATLNINGNAILTAGTFTAGTNVKVGGNWTNNGGTFTPGTNTITFNGTGAQTINGTAAAQTFYNFIVLKTAGTLLNTGGSTVALTTQDFTETTGNFTAPATLNVNGNVTLTAGTFTAGTNMNVAGNWANNGATFTAGTGTVTFTATAIGKTLTGTLNGTSKFNNLTFNGVGGAWTVSPAIEATGNFNLTNGTLTLSATLGNDLTIGGNWTRASTGTFVPNTRAVFFNGGSTQTITVTGGGTQAFDYLGINNTSVGGVVLSSSPATNVSIASTSGNVLQLLNSGPLDLNGQTLTLSGSGGNILVSGGVRNITATTAGTLAISGTKTVTTASSGTLVTSSNVTIALSSGLDFGSGLTTVNGTFRIDLGGFVTNNAPTYGTGSLLKYNSGSTPYGRSLEWRTASGAGYPYNVQISNNTTLSPGANANTGTTFSLAGNLTIDAGSALYMDYGGVNMTVALNIGGNLVLNGSLSESGVNGGDIAIKGDWTNNGSFFNNSRTVTFNNTTTDQNISGTAATTFGYLTLNKANAVKVNLSGSNGITVNNTATITLGTLVTNTNTVTLGSTATLSEASSQTILGNVTTTRSIAANVANTFGGIGLSITATNTPGSTVVTRVTGTAVTIANVGTVKRYFTIVPTTTATGATISFTYDVSELNGLTAAYLGLYDAPSPYTTYTSEGGTVSTYTITLTGATVANSRWTAAGGCYIWTGNTSTDWNTASNWLCGNVPTSTSNVVIPNPLTNQPTISSGIVSINNLQIAGNSTLTNNGTLKVAGAFTVSANGYVDNSNGTVELNGTSAQNIPASTFTNNTVKNLTISNTGGTVNLNGTLALTGVLSVTGGQTFATNGNLTLKSSASVTAQVSAVTGSITGNVVAERYIPAHRAWRLLATPVASTQTIHASWQENQQNTDLITMVNTTSGFGTQITGPTPLSNGFDVSPRNNYSMLSFVDTTTWNGVSNTSVLLSSQPAWMIFVRGDRSVDLNLNQYATPTTTRLRSTGPLRTGQKTFSIGASGFTLVGNPYASTINFHTAASKVGAPSDKFIVWDPNMTGQYGVGAFVTFTWNGSSYTHTTSASANLDEHIQSGEAFIVPGNGSSTTLTVDESDKNSGSVSTIFSATSTPESFTANLYTANTDGSKTLVDGTVAIFGSNYNTGIDNVDTRKLTNFNENIGLKRDGSVLAIEARPTISVTDTLQLDLTQTKILNYKLEIVCDKLDHPGLQGYLVDKYTNSTTNLLLNDTTYYSFAVNSAAGSYATDRFSVIFKTAAPLPVSYTSVRAYQQNSGINVEWGVTNEISIKEYQVEKSLTGNDFSKAGVVAAKLNNGSNGGYVWTDVSPTQGVNFYRIRSVSLSGDVKYSNIVKVVLGGKAGFVVYPNPISEGAVHLQMNNLPKGTYSVKLVNEAGQVVYTKDIIHQEGSSTETLKADKNLAHGNYYLEIIGVDQVTTKIKIIN